MTDLVTILRCALCKEPFTYAPTDKDLCPPGTPSQICDGCYHSLLEGYERDNETGKHSVKPEERDL